MSGWRGKYAYMSPEQIAGEPLTPQSDQFGFGVMLMELLTGRRPFDGDSPGETMDRIREARPPELPDVDVDLAALVLGCLEREPEARFESAEALRRAIEAARRRRDTAAAPDLARFVEETLAAGDGGPRRPRADTRPLTE